MMLNIFLQLYVCKDLSTIIFKLTLILCISMSIDTILTLSNKEKIYTSIGDTCTMPSYDDNLLNITKELLAPAMTWNILDKQSSAVITRSNITWSFTHHCREWGRISIRGWTLYRTLAGELWGVFRECYGENWLRYYSTALYIYIYIYIYEFM